MSNPNPSGSQLLRATPPHVLYHYTGAATFEKIVTSNVIRATFARASNDRWETLGGILAFEKALSQVVPDSDMAKQLVDEFKGKVDHAKRNGFPLFIVSFCPDDHNRVLWGKYAEQGQGWAIGFDFSSVVISGMVSPAHPKFAQVKYGNDAVERHALDVLQHSVSLLNTNDTSDVLIEEKPKVLEVFWECLSIFKNAHWGDEEEWRAAVHAPNAPWYLPDGTPCDGWDESVSRSLHIRLPLTGGPGGASHLPITDVVLGKYSMCMEDDVKKMLRDNGYLAEHINIRRSATEPV